MNKQRQKQLLTYISSLVMTLSLHGCKLVINGKDYIETDTTTPYKITEEEKQDLKPYEIYLKDLKIDINNCDIVTETENTIYVQERIYEEYKVTDEINLSDFLELQGIKEKDFYQINENTKDYLKTDEEGNKILKKDKTIIIYTNKFHEISKVENENKDWIYYHVQENDNLTKIAKNYNTTVEKLCELNKIKNPNYITTDQTLKIPHPEKNKVKIKSKK